MRKIILTMSAAALLVSCGSEPKSESVSTQAVTETDTTKTAVAESSPSNPELEAVLMLFASQKEMPFEISTEEIDKMEPKTNLKTKDVSMLTSAFTKSAWLSDAEYALKDFYKIDSVKEKGNYKDWAEQLELGETRRSDAFPLYKTETGPSSYVLFWVLDYATVEACPYSWAKTVFATAVNKNVVGETIVFAEHSGGGDAPISFDRKIKGAFSAGNKISLNLHEELDEDEPKVEITEGLFELEVKEGKFLVTKEDKQKPKMVKRKA